MADMHRNADRDVIGEAGKGQVYKAPLSRSNFFAQNIKRRLRHLTRALCFVFLDMNIDRRTVARFDRYICGGMRFTHDIADALHAVQKFCSPSRITA